MIGCVIVDIESFKIKRQHAQCVSTIDQNTDVVTMSQPNNLLDGQNLSRRTGDMID